MLLPQQCGAANECCLAIDIEARSYFKVFQILAVWAWFPTRIMHGGPVIKRHSQPAKKEAVMKEPNTDGECRMRRGTVNFHIRALCACCR